jgi:hypothetical protein
MGYGYKDRRMDKEKKFFRMVLIMRAISLTESKQDKEHFNGKMVQNMKVDLWIIYFVDMVRWNIQMEGNMKEIF